MGDGKTIEAEKTWKTRKTAEQRETGHRIKMWETRKRVYRTKGDRKPNEYVKDTGDEETREAERQREIGRQGTQKTQRRFQRQKRQ